MVNLAESWVGLRVVRCNERRYRNVSLIPVKGGDKYQQAFYVFEELAQAPSTSSVRSLVSQAVCELHLGRLEEAQAALEQALEKDANYANTIANLLVLNVIAGNDTDELTEYVTNTQCLITIINTIRRSLKKADPNHALLAGLEEKSALFDKAATKYSPKVSA